MNQLEKKYPEEIKKVLAKYPSDQKRSAVMPLLYLAQREDGYVSEKDMEDIAELCEISSTHVASIVGFYTLYYDKPEGKYRIQVCTDMPCALRGADKFLAELCDALGIEPHGTTEDHIATVEPVMCLAACDRAPMFQLQSGEGLSYHEHMTVESTIAMIQELRQKATA